MKKLICLFVAAAMVVSFAGCSNNKKSSSGSKNSNVTLKVLTHWTNLTKSDGSGWLDKFADKFEKETGAKVKFEAITDYATEVKTRLSSGNYGDVLDIPTGVATSDLPSFFAKIGNSNDDDLKDYYYTYVDGIKNSDGSYDVYGLSYGLSIVGAVYNKAAFKKAGIDEFPTTLDGLYDACAKLKAAGIVPVAINFKDKWPLSSAFDAIPLFASHDGNWQNTVYKTTDLFSADKPYGVSLSILNKLVSNKWVEPDLTTTNWEQSKSDLGTGKVGMMFLGSWAVPQMAAAATNPDDIGFAPIPTDNTGKLYTYASQDYMMGIAKNTKYYDLARKYLMEFTASDFAGTQGFAPIIKGQESSDKVIKDFMATGVTVIMGEPGETGEEGSNMTKIGNEAGIDFWGGMYLQDVAIASQQGKFDQVVKELNKRWNEAKTTCGF
ncbi:extracellular solute-binding protein [[Clostridium] cellulosi]|jgi:Bacterial extracellular solute-binding protein.